jgi:hypothetical protein
MLGENSSHHYWKFQIDAAQTKVLRPWTAHQGVNNLSSHLRVRPIGYICFVPLLDSLSCRLIGEKCPEGSFSLTLFLPCERLLSPLKDSPWKSPGRSDWHQTFCQLKQEKKLEHKEYLPRKNRHWFGKIFNFNVSSRFVTANPRVVLSQASGRLD